MRAIRFCEATGRYFCSKCHTGKKCIVPGRVIESWDFAKYEVCDRAYTFLNSAYLFPSYNIDVINPQLYEDVKGLGKVKVAKQQLEHLLVYLKDCSSTKAKASK